MAKILLAGLPADARGKLAGFVFSRNASGTYIRTKVSPVQPRTPAQLAVREAVTWCAQYWRDTMTPAMRLAWEAYAKTTPLADVFGKRLPRKGMAMFLRYNSFLRRCGLTPVTTAPPIGGECAMPFGPLTGTDADGVKLTSLVPTLTAGDLVSVAICAAPMSQARNFYSGPWQYKMNLTNITTYPATLVAGDLTVIGQRWFVRLRMFAKNAMVGPPWQGYVDILA